MTARGIEWSMWENIWPYEEWCNRHLPLARRTHTVGYIDDLMILLQEVLGNPNPNPKDSI